MQSCAPSIARPSEVALSEPASPVPATSGPPVATTAKPAHTPAHVTAAGNGATESVVRHETPRAAIHHAVAPRVTTTTSAVRSASLPPRGALPAQAAKG